MAFVVVGAFLVGWLIRSLVAVPQSLPARADFYVLRCALPALIFSKISRMEFDGAMVTPIVLAWVVMATSVVLLIASAKALQWSSQTTGALLLVGVLGNTSFLGLGMVEGLLGSEYLPAAIAYDQIGTFLALALYGSFVASRWGSGSFTVASVLRRLFTFAPFVALLFALVARNLAVPEVVYDIFDPLGRTVGPVAMGALGLRFHLRVSPSVVRPAAIGLTIKMLVGPGLILLAAWMLGNRGQLTWDASVLEAAMPPMITAGVVAVGAGLDEDLVAFMVGIGTLLSFLSVPIISLML